MKIVTSLQKMSLYYIKFLINQVNACTANTFFLCDDLKKN